MRCSEDESEWRIFRFIHFYLRMIGGSGNMESNNCRVRARENKNVWILYR